MLAELARRRELSGRTRARRDRAARRTKCTISAAPLRPGRRVRRPESEPLAVASLASTEAPGGHRDVRIDLIERLRWLHCALHKRIAGWRCSPRTARGPSRIGAGVCGKPSDLQV
jgi:hypothetical protein